MENITAQRIRERLDSLQLTQTEAETRAKLTRGYLSDLFTGKKQQPRLKALQQLASVLGCSPQYLLGQTPLLRPTNGRTAAPVAPTQSLPLGGVIEAGVWRNPDSLDETLPVHVAPDSRYPPAGQSAFLVRGRGCIPLGIQPGSILVVSRDIQPRPGDLVVVSRARPQGETETTLKSYSAPAIQDSDLEGSESEPEKTLGTVVLEIRTF